MRYAQRQLSFALEETDSKDSRAMILMLKLMETVLANIRCVCVCVWLCAKSARQHQCQDQWGQPHRAH